MADLDGTARETFSRKKEAKPYWPFPENGRGSKTFYTPRYTTADYTEGLQRAKVFMIDNGWRTYTVPSTSMGYNVKSAAVAPKHLPTWKARQQDLEEKGLYMAELHPKEWKDIQTLVVETTTSFVPPTVREYPPRRIVAVSPMHVKMQRRLRHMSASGISGASGSDSAVVESEGQASRPGTAASLADGTRRFRPATTSSFGADVPLYGTPVTTAEALIRAERVALGVPGPKSGVLHVVSRLHSPMGGGGPGPRGHGPEVHVPASPRAESGHAGIPASLVVPRTPGLVGRPATHEVGRGEEGGMAANLQDTFKTVRAGSLLAAHGGSHSGMRLAMEATAREAFAGSRPELVPMNLRAKQETQRPYTVLVTSPIAKRDFSALGRYNKPSTTAAAWVGTYAPQIVRTYSPQVAIAPKADISVCLNVKAVAPQSANALHAQMTMLPQSSPIKLCGSSGS